MKKPKQLKVRIKKGKNKGWIIYNKETKTISVEFPDSQVKKEVEKFFRQTLDIYIPRKNKLDYYEIIPEQNAYLNSDNFHYFILTLPGRVPVEVIEEESTCFEIEKGENVIVIHPIY